MEKHVHHISEFLDAHTSRVGGEPDAPREQMLKTGVRDIDEVVGGIERGSLTVLASDAWLGHMALWTTLLNSVAVNAGEKTLYVTVAGSLTDAVRSIVSNLVGVSYHAVRLGRLDTAGKQLVLDGLERIRQAPLHYCSAFGLTVDDVLRQVDDCYDFADDQSTAQLRCVIIEGLPDLVAGPTRVPRDVEVRQVVRKLKEIAENLDVAVALMVELNPDRDGATARALSPPNLKHYHAMGRYIDTLLVLDSMTDQALQGEEITPWVGVAYNRCGPTVKTIIREVTDTFRIHAVCE